ncbi:MAG: DUF433 domain-containing protein [Deltaproteobacteria bacterium]|nr:DUF433 domain-containing protein [Deltaproteobacteria bacterium]
MRRVEAVKASNHPYVERKKKVCGGRPVIRGTRFPVSSIVWNHKLGFTVEEILREFPHLTPAQVYDALSYYSDHQPEIEEEIRQAHDLDAWMEKYPPTLKVKRGRHSAVSR